MAKFKCLSSGNIIEFVNEVDIKSMAGHPGYVEVKEEEKIEEQKEEAVRRGRKPKDLS